MTAGRIVSLFFGGLLLAIGIALVLGGGTLVGIDLTYTDETGYLALPPTHLERDTYAVVAPLKIEGEWMWWYRNPSTVRVTVTPTGAERPVFIGIASRQSIDAYLSDVSYAEIKEFRFQRADERKQSYLKYTDHIASSPPEAPSEQTFWQATATGPDTEVLSWTLEPGDWSLVLMNVDGARGINVMGSLAVRAPWLLGAGIGILAAGFVIGAAGLLIVLLVARRTRAEVEASGVAPGASPTEEFPLTLKGQMADTLSPWAWLFKWFLLIPHYIILGFLSVGFAFSWFFSLVAIVLTGRYPRALFDFNVGFLRWTWRVGFYSYQALGTDTYPPFSLKAGGYPADLEIAYPEHLSPGRALVKWWLLAIPHYAVLSLIQGGGVWYYGGLVVVLTLIAGVSMLFTGRYPADLFRFVMGLNRWSYRVAAYAALMTDTYPPFRLDQ